MHDLIQRITVLERENSSTLSVQSSTQQMAITSLPPSPSHHTANRVNQARHEVEDYKRQSFLFFEAQLEQRLSSSDDENEEVADNDDNKPVLITDLDSLNGDGDSNRQKKEEEYSPDLYFVSSSNNNSIGDHCENQDQVNLQDDYYSQQNELQRQQEAQQQMRQFLSPPVDSGEDHTNHLSNRHQQKQQQGDVDEEKEFDSVQLSDLLQFKI